MSDCVFCKIAAGEIPCDKVFENDKVIAFRDLHPQAKVHILIVPKVHVENVLECSDKRNGLIANLFEAVSEVARAQGLDKTGFRVVTNCGRDGAQSVNHLHFHLLGGEPLSGHMA